MTQEQITDTNCIICGDCRDQLARIPDGSVDLIYLDPPFFSGKNYEIIWKDGSEIRSFTDTEFYTLICECGKVFPDKNKFCADCGAARDKAIEHKSKDIQAYLQWLRPRLEICKDKLKDTGSIYCHLDWHAVHYVKVMMDDIFEMKNFQNEIAWCYNAPINSQKRFCRKHDTILFYSKSNEWNFNPDDVRVPYGDWAKGKTSYKTKSFGLKEAKDIELNTKGRLCPDYWDIPMLASSAKERLGYPTQKPEVLLERIIKASSNPGDVVLDPFCGCGTAVAVAQKLGRKWIGIDISPTSCKLMVKRLRSITMGITDGDIVDLPRTCAELREMDPTEFQNLVITKLDGKQNPKKTDDKGIDGWTYKTDEFGMRHKLMGLDAAVQVKRSGDTEQGKKSNSVGRPTTQNLVGAMATDPDIDGKHGIIVAFSFSKPARDHVKDLKVKAGITIDLVTVKELFDCE